MTLMEAPFDTEFLIRRHTQLLVQAADLPERSSAQAHIEQLACKLSVYVSKLADEPSKKRRARRTGCFSENAEPRRGCFAEFIQVAQAGPGMPCIARARLGLSRCG